MKMIVMEKELLPETLNYIKSTELAYRKKLGQFFTPKSLRKLLISKLPRLDSPKVLDPGCGTGEFLLEAKNYFNNPQLYGWEIDERLVKIAQKIVPEAIIEKVDALKKDYFPEFDVVIGNPPYFELKKNKEIRKKFNEILKGRINIYALFVYIGIKLLKPGGYLAYIISPSMNNGAYFAKLREFIISETNIEYLHILEGDYFDGALQSVMLFILKKGENKGNYVFRRNGMVIFSENVKYLNKISQNTLSLSDLGYKVQTGKIVWNQNKHLLTNNPSEGICLIWSHNITPNGLKLNNHKKRPQYIKSNKYDIGPAIVVNRIVGRPKNNKIKAALVPPGFKFLAENHVNVIYPPKSVNLSELMEIINQLNSPESQNFLISLTGNTQISKNELEKLFPIKLSSRGGKDEERKEEKTFAP
jgi:adenine-specific DNA-methyltransferase